MSLKSLRENLVGWGKKVPRRAIFVFFGAVGVLLILALLFLVISSYKDTWRLKSRLSSNPEWQKMYDYAQEGQKTLTSESSEEQYLGVAFRWKSLADVTGEKEFYLKALKIYNDAITNTEFNRYLLTLNAGNVARLLGDFKLADKYYLAAIELNPGEAGTYMTRAEMLKINLRASKEEIQNFYKQGLAVLIGREYLRLANDYAAYLKEIGELEPALEQYKLLRTVMPANQTYINIVAEIENLLKQK